MTDIVSEILSSPRAFLNTDGQSHLKTIKMIMMMMMIFIIIMIVLIILFIIMITKSLSLEVPAFLHRSVEV